MKRIQVEKIAQLTGHRAAVFAISQDLGSAKVLSGAGDGWVVEWDLSQPELGRLITKVESNIFSLLYLPQHQLLLAGNMNGGLHWVDLQHPKKTRNILHHKKGVFDIQLIEGHIYSIGGGGILTRWSLEQRRALESIQLSSKALRSMAYCAAKNELAIGASDHHIHFLELSNFEVRGKIPNAHNNSVFTVRYSPDHRYLLSGGRDAFLHVWDFEDGLNLVSAQAAHMYTINSLEFHPKAPIFATASRDRSIKIWSLEDFRLLKVLETIRDHGHLASVNKLLWSDSGPYLISASDDRSLIIWDIKYM